MTNNRAQGLPLNIIVLGALALLSMVVLGAFFLSGSSGTFAKFGAASSEQTAGTDKASAISACKSICGNAQAMANQLDEDSACRAYVDGWVQNECWNEVSDCAVDVDSTTDCVFGNLDGLSASDCGSGNIACTGGQ